MLNEKKVINDKLLMSTLLATASGFLLGVGLFMCGAAFITHDAALGVIGGLIIVLASGCGHLGDKTRKAVRAFINQPYLYSEKKNEVDSATH